MPLSPPTALAGNSPGGFRLERDSHHLVIPSLNDDAPSAAAQRRGCASARPELSGEGNLLSALWDGAVFGKGMASAMPHQRETCRTPRKGGRNRTLWGLPSLLYGSGSGFALALGFSFDFAGASIGSHTLGVALAAAPLHKSFFFTALRRGCPVLARFSQGREAQTCTTDVSCDINPPPS